MSKSILDHVLVVGFLGQMVLLSGNAKAIETFGD